ncbi:MAG TPA: hypothetical protein PKC98_18315, partial [Candidatus Melainabacteria bacterium]|nr:hypothetical protein [Candidatus Melainabacteria bacterium]
MNRKLKTLLGLTLAQTIVALSLPLSACAGTIDGADSPDFALPLNDKIQLSTDGGALVTEKVSIPASNNTSSSPILSIEEALGEDAEVVVFTDEEADVIVIDNDLETEVAFEEEYKWEEIADSPDKTKIAAGARFPVCVISSISSKTAKKGDPVEARLMTDIKIGGRLIARRGDMVIGRIDTVSKA